MKKYLIGFFRLALRVLQDPLILYEGIRFKQTIIIRKKKAGSSKWVQTQVISNKLLKVGIAQAMLLLGDGAAIVFGYGAFGEGTTPPTEDDEALESEVDRQVTAFSRITTVFTNDTGKWIVTTAQAPGGGWEITEFGLVNAAADGTFYNRAQFGAESLSENDQLEITCKIQGLETV